jgi:hypothetical protein
VKERTLKRRSGPFHSRQPREEVATSVHLGRTDISAGGKGAMQDLKRQDLTSKSIPRQMLAHDHAWRRISSRGEEPALLEGRYRCDLCSAEWAL